jgi:hypothetical protein
MKANKSKPEKRLKSIRARCFGRERDALTRLNHLGVISAKLHKQRYDLLVEKAARGK